MFNASYSHSTSPLLQCIDSQPLQHVDLCSLQIILVKDSASSNASITWRYFGLLTTTPPTISSSLSAAAAAEATSAAVVGTDADRALAQSPVPSLASSDLAELSVPNVINRGFYYCKLCLEREQDEFRATAGRHGNLTNVHKYSVHTATTAYKSHLFNAHGVIDKGSTVSGSSVKLEPVGVEDFCDLGAMAQLSSLSKKLIAGPTTSNSNKTEQPAWTTEEFHRDVCLWLVRDLRPLESVIERGFGEFCSKNFPHFPVPNPTSLGRNWLDQMYADVKSRLRTSLGGVQSVCVMVDAWTDRHRRIPCLGLRVAYVESASWMFRMASLSVKVAPHQTGAERAAHVRAELRDFGIADDCIIYTTDDGSEASRHCGRLLKTAHETLCVARSLDRLLVGDALAKVSETCKLMNKCVNVVETLYCRLGLVADELPDQHTSELASLGDQIERIKRWIELDERVVVPGLDDDDAPVGSVPDGEINTTECAGVKSEICGSQKTTDVQALPAPTVSRWIVVLTMLEGLLGMIPVVQSTLVKCGNRELCFDEQELNAMKAIVKFLEPFREFSEMVGGNHPHLGLLLMVRDQVDDFCRPCRRDGDVIAVLKRKIRQNLERRIPVDDTVLTASILEPGTRAIVAVDQEEQIRIVAKIWTDNENELAPESVGGQSKASRESLMNIQQPVAEQMQNCASPSTDCDSLASSCVRRGVESKRKRIIKQILQRRGLSIGGEETIQSEVTRYLNTKATEDEEGAPLMFWKNNQKNFPRLYRLARNLLSVAAGSVVVDAMFSTLGLHLSGQRSQLAPSVMNRMSVVHDYYSIL